MILKNCSNNIFDRNAYSNKLKNQNDSIKEILRPREVSELNAVINSYVNPIEAFRREGNYVFDPNVPNRKCYKKKIGKLFAQECNASQNENIVQGKYLNTNDYKQLKKSLPEIKNENVEPMTKSVQFKNKLDYNDLYFYKSSEGDQMKNKHYKYTNKL